MLLKRISSLRWRVSFFMDVHSIPTFHTKCYFTVIDDDNILKTCIVDFVTLNYDILKN